MQLAGSAAGTGIRSAGMPFAGFSDLELLVIALRTNGIRPGDIALRLGCRYNSVLNALKRVYEKVGFTDLCLLTRWAIQNGLDAEPETFGDTPSLREARAETDPLAVAAAGCAAQTSLRIVRVVAH